MYKFRDEFCFKINTRNLDKEYIEKYKEEIINAYINHFYIHNYKPLFNSKDYLETIKRKDR